MSLTSEQKQTVASWVAAGDNLSTVQKKLIEHFKLTMTYRDVRFLVDDLELTLKDPAPKVDASDVTKVPPAAKPAAPQKKAAAQPSEDAGAEAGEATDLPPEGAEPAEDEAPLDELPPGDANVTVDVDQVTLIPGALASGSVTFSDGITAKWIVDQYGRPGFTEVSQPGYRPTPTDGQAFMQELSRALQAKGF